MNSDDRLVAQGIRLRKMREEFSRSPEEVAACLGFGNRQSVYDLEAGRRDLKAYEALQLAEYYRVSTDSLLSGSEEVSPVVHWRGEADVTAEKILLTRLDRYSRLESLADLKRERSIPSFSLSSDSSYEYVGEIAASVADLLNLGKYPARVLAESVRKKWNVVVFHAPLGGASGACIRKDGICGVLLNSNEVWWRRNFSLGHELFHLIFSDCSGVDPKRIETLANIFASNLLMPSDLISNDLKELSSGTGYRYFDLMDLAREYMVSTEALLWRMCSLGIIQKDAVDNFRASQELKSLDRDIHGEVKRDEEVLPQYMVMLAYRVYLNGSISVGKLAEYLETNVARLKGVLKSRGIDPFAEYYETSLSHT